jgi:hypothetical protein
LEELDSSIFRVCAGTTQSAIPDVSEELESSIFRVCADTTYIAQNQTMGVAVSSMYHIPENLNLHHDCYQNLGFPNSAAVYMHFCDSF